MLGLTKFPIMKYICLFVVLLFVVIIMAKLYSTFKNKDSLEGFQSSGDKFLFNSKFQYLVFKKSNTSSNNNILDYDDARVYVDIKNKNGSLFHLIYRK